MTTSPRAHFPELIRLANEITFDGVADVQIEHRCVQLVRGFEPTASESHPAARMLAQVLRLVVGNRMVAATASEIEQRTQASCRARAFVAVAGSLLPIVLQEKAEASQ